MRSAGFKGAVVAVGALALVLAVSGSAFGAEPSPAPWWHVSLSALPANVTPGTAHDEIQEVTVAADAGEWYVEAPANTERSEALKFDAPDGEVQSALESLYGAGNVEVTGGVGDATGSSPYVVKFVGRLSDQPVAVIGAASYEPGELFCVVLQRDCPLEGGVPASGAAAREQLKGAADGSLVVTATNLGDTDAAGATVSDVLPKGLRAVAVEGRKEEAVIGKPRVSLLSCSLEQISCVLSGTLAPYRQIEMLVSVIAEPGATSGEINEARVTSVGHTAGASARRGVSISGAAAFGIENYELAGEEFGGAPDVQAGSHPFQVTNVVQFNQNLEPGTPPAMAKDVAVNLPAGLIGNPSILAQCTDPEFLTSSSGVDECPADTAVGVASVRIYDPQDYGVTAVTLTVPIFNLTPRVGEPARFGFDVQNVPVFLDTAVRTGKDYGVTVTAANAPQTVTFIGGTFTFWGVPGAKAHELQRGWSCVYDEHYVTIAGLSKCAGLKEQAPKPLLSMPTSCEGELATSAEADSWTDPSHPVSAGPTVAMPGMVGCNELPSEPSLEVAPDGSAASTPTGLDVHIRVPQQVDLDENGTAEADVKVISVALPVGVHVSPSAADGLEACTLSEIGYSGENAITHVQEFSAAQPQCPEASKLATVKIKTPLLPNPLEGSVYLASPQNFQGPIQNPFGSLIAMYLVAYDPVSGVLVKLPLKAETDHVTGQLVATQEVPQVPFEEAEVHFFGTARAPLTTPALCKNYTTSATITPWSGNPPSTAYSSFAITTGPNGTGSAGCTSPRPFTPGFTAGSTNLQAAAFTPFTMTLTRPDQDQMLAGVELQMPPGFSGDLTHVKLCGEAEANAGTCGPESQIGETIVSAGLGGDPYTVTGGKVYLTTGYKGASFGLSIVNPAQAGPFVLQEGRPVIVRAALFINPITAAVRVVSDPLPTIIDGIPLQIQHVNVTLSREKFAFNPTNCSSLHISGALSSSPEPGEPASMFPVGVPFQVTNCATLAFKPKLTASLKGQASKKDGAAFSVKLTYPAGPYDANIAKVKVDLPIQLPTEQRTLTKACLAKVFQENPANCPKYSVVGHAKAITPIIPVPLQGPAYFVSYGNEKFPNLVMVLQGYGITIDLTGTTFISKKGITSSTFKAVPDQPVGSFELTLPQGPYSALAANLPHSGQNFCGTKLGMPTSFVAQNGVEQHLTTAIIVAGCPRTHKAQAPKGTKK